jgi:UDP-N-acetylglucosamine acyltransferase
MNKIHPTVIIGQNVKLGDGLEIEPYTCLDGDIEIGDDCRLGPQVTVRGWVKIGAGTRIYPHAAIGEPPQDYAYDGQPGLVEIGAHCQIREGVTIHTPVNGAAGQVTRIGNHAFLMTCAHVGHNAQLGDHCILASGCVLGGHVRVEERAFLSGNVAVHQFCRVGAYALVGGLSKVTQDIPPYMLANGDAARVYGINVVGLRRNQFTADDRSRIKDAYQAIYSGRMLRTVLAELAQKHQAHAPVMRLVNFVQGSRRGIASGCRN